MSDEKFTSSHREHDLESNGIQRQLTTVTLSPQQFESLYLQPRLAGRTNLVRQVANAAPLGVSSFLLAHMPLAMDLLGFQGADGDSGLATLGAFYACAGIGLYLASIMEWVVGNTFPMVVFGTFGGFWTSYAILIQPSFRVAAGFAPANVTDSTFAGVTATAAGAATRSYNSGVGVYFVTWAILCFFYFIASLRTNVPFVIIFFTLTVAFSCIGAAHFHTGVGELSKAAMEFKVAGGFAFVTGLAGFWIDASLILAAVDFPIRIPVIDLSARHFMRSRRQETQDKARAD